MNRLEWTVVAVLAGVTGSGCCTFNPALCKPKYQYVWTQPLNESTHQGFVIDIERTGSELIAVGATGNRAAKPCYWRSSNGATWIGPTEAYTGSAQTVGAISAVSGRPGGGELIAVGWSNTPVSGPLVWRYNAQEMSPVGLFTLDGQAHPNMVPNDAALIPNSPSQDLAVAVGYAFSVPDNKRQAIVIRSQNNWSTWKEVFREPIVSTSGGVKCSSEVTAIAAMSGKLAANGGPAFVAVGYVEIEKSPAACLKRGAIWTSADGTTWKRRMSDFPSEFSTGTWDSQLLSVSANDVAIYVAGGDGAAASDTGVKGSMIWQSIDKGLKWQRLSDVEPASKQSFPGSHGVTAIRVGSLPFSYNAAAVGRWNYRSGGFWRGAQGYPLWSGSEVPEIGFQSSARTLSYTDDVIVVGGTTSNSTGQEQYPAIWMLSKQPAN